MGFGFPRIQDLIALNIFFVGGVVALVQFAHSYAHFQKGEVVVLSIAGEVTSATEKELVVKSAVGNVNISLHADGANFVKKENGVSIVFEKDEPHAWLEFFREDESKAIVFLRGYSKRVGSCGLSHLHMENNVLTLGFEEPLGLPITDWIALAICVVAMGALGWMKFMPRKQMPLINEPMPKEQTGPEE